jgi:hypothetical protein
MKEQESHNQGPSDQLWINKLNDLHFKPEPGEWETLHSKLSQHQEDNLLREQIHFQYQSYPNAPFENLERRIKRHHQNVRYIRAAKLAELFAFWLLILILIQGGMDLNTPSPNHDINYYDDTALHDNNNNNNNNNVVTETPSEPTQPYPGRDEVPKDKTQSLRSKRKAIASNVSKSINPAPNLQNSVDQSTMDNILNEKLPFDMRQIDLSVNQANPAPTIVHSETAHLPIKITPIAHNTHILAPLHRPTFTLAPIQSNSNSWWIDLGAVISRDLIKSPYPIQISEERLGRISGSGGLNTGVVYSTPITDLAIYAQYQFKSYESVYGGSNQIHMIGIPLQIRFKLPKMGAFQGYIATGLLPQFAAYAHYSETSFFETNPHLRYRENNIKLNSAGILSTSAYENGILEGESYRGNQSISAILGIGAEYQLNERFKIYLEQSYQHSLGRSAFGPGFDQFFSSTIHVGVRTPIKFR